MTAIRSLFSRQDPLPPSPAEFFSALPVQETARLILRPMRMSDAGDIYAYSKDPEVARHVLWEAHRSLLDSRSYLRFILRQYRRGEPSSYAIVLKETNRVIGTIGWMSYSEEIACTEVGYSLAREQWDKGLMSEALECVISLSFQRLTVNRVEAMHETDNPASGRVMEKCGMRREGVMRQRIYNKGRYADVALYAILREDWRGTHNY